MPRVMKQLLVVVVGALVCLAVACEDAPSGPAPSRVNGVRRPTAGEAGAKAASSFCEKSWPAGGEGQRKLIAPAERPIPGAPAALPAKAGAWKWVNLWATWCHPCVEEMPLLDRWRGSLEKDGVALNVELYSVDDDDAAVSKWLQGHSMPGNVRLLRSADDLPAVLESLGADRQSAIPVHALVDGNDNVRCLRVGQVHDEDYAAIKAMLTGA